jgi:hypothetical protein
MNKNWKDNFITKEDALTYIAWDETQANEIGRYATWREASDALDEYVKHLEKENLKDEKH